MSTAVKGLTVDQYDRMVEKGILPETNRFELIEGRIVEKDVKKPAHPTATRRTMRAIERILPAGWHVRKEDPVRIPNRRSEPEPDLAVVRGDEDAYQDRHPGPEDIALVVEVTRSTVAKDRALARVYGPGGIPVYWIVNLPKRRLEVYSHPVPLTPIARVYPAPVILGETESVDLTIEGQVVGQIPVADLLPRRSMTADFLRHLDAQRPFRPCRLVLTDGFEVPVSSPGVITVPNEDRSGFRGYPGRPV